MKTFKEYILEKHGFHGFKKDPMEIAEKLFHEKQQLVIQYRAILETMSFTIDVALRETIGREDE